MGKNMMGHEGRDIRGSKVMPWRALKVKIRCLCWKDAGMHWEPLDRLR